MNDDTQTNNCNKLSLGCCSIDLLNAEMNEFTRLTSFSTTQTWTPGKTYLIDDVVLEAGSVDG